MTTLTANTQIRAQIATEISTATTRMHFKRIAKLIRQIDNDFEVDLRKSLQIIKNAIAEWSELYIHEEEEEDIEIEDESPKIDDEVFKAILHTGNFTKDKAMEMAKIINKAGLTAPELRTSTEKLMIDWFVDVALPKYQNR